MKMNVFLASCLLSGIGTTNAIEFKAIFNYMAKSDVTITSKDDANFKIVVQPAKSIENINVPGEAIFHFTKDGQQREIRFKGIRNSNIQGEAILLYEKYGEAKEKKVGVPADLVLRFEDGRDPVLSYSVPASEWHKLNF